MRLDNMPLPKKVRAPARMSEKGVCKVGRMAADGIIENPLRVSDGVARHAMQHEEVRRDFDHFNIKNPEVIHRRIHGWAIIGGGFVGISSHV